METDEFKKAYADVEKAYEEAKPEIQTWMDEHWKSSWSEEDSGDRWDLNNLADGWNLDEVRQEFDEFFAVHDSTIADDDHEDADKFQLELKQTMGLYDKGIASGKVTNEENWKDTDARFKKLHDIAMLSARNSELRKNNSMHNRVTSDNDEPLLTKTDLLILAIFFTFLLLAFALGYYIRRKRMSTQISQREAQINEMQQNPVFVAVPDEISEVKQVRGHTTQGAYGNVMQAIRNERRAR